MNSAPPPAIARKEETWRRLRVMVLVFIAGWIVALAYHAVMGRLLGRGYPYDTFLFARGDASADLVHSWEQALAPDPYRTPNPAVATYFPLTYAMLRLFRGASREALVRGYQVLAWAGALGLAAAWLTRARPAWRSDPRWATVVAAVVALSAVNYPFLFAIDRGNLDPFVALTLVASAAALRRGPGPAVAGGALLGLASGLKGYSLAAVLLWVRDRRWWGVGAIAVTFVAALVLPCLAFPGGLAGTLEGLRQGLARFHEAYVVGDASAHFSSDWINAIRLAGTLLQVRPPMGAVVRAYELVAMLWAGALALHAVLVSREIWRAWLALALLMLVFPNVVNDYKLVLLVPVVLAWLESDASGWRSAVFCVCAALLLVPKRYGAIAGGDAAYSCLLNPFLLLGLNAVLWPTVGELTALRARVCAVRRAFAPTASGALR